MSKRKRPARGVFFIARYLDGTQFQVYIKNCHRQNILINHVLFMAFHYTHILRPLGKGLVATYMVALAFGGLPLTVIAATADPVPAENPVLTNSCGLDIALVLDNSHSISEKELDQMKDALHSFVNTLNPTTSTWFSVSYFNRYGHVQQGFTSSAAIVNAAIDLIPHRSGPAGTNWQDGLVKAASTFDPRPGTAHQNLIIFASDGHPTSDGTSGNVPGTALDNAIIAANDIKGDGTRIITIGVSRGVNEENMMDISSEDAYHDATDAEGLAAVLSEIADDICGGTITVHKVIDQDGDLETENDQAAGPDWDFTVADSDETTDETGVTEAVFVEEGSYTVTEIEQENYTLVGATCAIDGDEVGTFASSSVSGIRVGDDDIVSCTFYNTPTTPQEPIRGCTNPLATNYNPAATEDDGSCDLPEEPVLGCTDPSAENYDDDATQDNGSCEYPVETGTLTIVKNTVGGDATFDFTLTESEAVATTSQITTSENTGTQDLSLHVGTYSISEGSKDGWAQTSLVCTQETDSVPLVVDAEAFTLEVDTHITCTFTNTKDSTPPAEPTDLCSNIEGVQASVPEGMTANGGVCAAPAPEEEPRSSGGGGGPRCKDGESWSPSLDRCVPDGSVLGASTGQVLGESCGLYMDQYLKKGGPKNNPGQVTKLQAFLNKHGFGTFTPTGYFGPLTEAAVKSFQLKYAEQILKPWGISAPTGLAYLTTLRQVNLIECPELMIPVPTLVDWNKNPSVQ